MEENNKKDSFREPFLFLRWLYVCRYCRSLGSATFSNYFKEVYHVDSAREGSWKYRENRRGFCVH